MLLWQKFNLELSSNSHHCSERAFSASSHHVRAELLSSASYAAAVDFKTPLHLLGMPSLIPISSRTANDEVTVKAAIFSVALELCIRLAAFRDIQQDLMKGVSVGTPFNGSDVLLQVKPLSQSDAHSSASQGFPLPSVPLPGRRS